MLLNLFGCEAPSSLRTTNCDTWYADLDGDGFGDLHTRPWEECGTPAAATLAAGDCDDTDAAVNPDAFDRSLDGIDQDCDGTDRCADATSRTGPDCDSGDAVLTGALDLSGDEALADATCVCGVAGALSVTWIHEPDAFTGLQNLAYVGGTLELQGIDGPVDLSGLASLRSVGALALHDPDSLVTLFPSTEVEVAESILVQGAAGLRDLDGLVPAASFRTVSLVDDDALHDLSDLAGIESLALLDLQALHALTSAEGFSTLREVGDLNLVDTGLADVGGFAGLTTLGGSLLVESNPRLENLDGFAALTHELVETDRIRIARNPALVRIGGFGALAEVAILEIETNGALEAVDGFDALTRVKQMSIAGNTSLVQIAGFPHLRDVESNLDILDNPALVEVSAFGQCERIGNLTLEGNGTADLVVHGLDWLTELGVLSVRGNPGLATLDLGGRIRGTSWIVVDDNPSLATLDGLESLEVAVEAMFGNLPRLAQVPDFADLARVDGMLSFRGLDGLTAIEGFPALESAGAIHVEDNAALRSLGGFDVLFHVGTLVIDGNPQLPQEVIDAFVARIDELGRAYP